MIDARPEQVNTYPAGLASRSCARTAPVLRWLIRERSTIGLTPSTVEGRMLTRMQIRFQRTELVNASPQRMFAVLTDYAEYPRINGCVTRVKVLHHDAHRASVAADRRTPIEPHVRLVDTYAPLPLLQLERRYASTSTSASTWTVEPAHGGRSYFTIAGCTTVPALLGVVVRRLVWSMFNQINFAPFIAAAEAHAGRLAMHRTLS